MSATKYGPEKGYTVYRVEKEVLKQGHLDTDRKLTLDPCLFTVCPKGPVKKYLPIAWARK